MEADKAHCELCKKRVSMWELTNQKTQIINYKLYHKACLMDATVRQLEKS